MQTRTRNWLSLGAAPLALGLALLVPARASHAAVDAVITHTPVTPESPPTGTVFRTTFRADVSNRPGSNNECQILNKRYHWTITANNGSTTVTLYDNPNGRETFLFAHRVNEVCHYQITASCTVTYLDFVHCHGFTFTLGQACDNFSVLSFLMLGSNPDIEKRFEREICQTWLSVNVNP